MNRFENDDIKFEEWCQANVDVWKARGITKPDTGRAIRASKPKEGAATLLDKLEPEGVDFGILSAGSELCSTI